MKGLILSGGTGSRLRPLTHTHAKQLLPIANKPILHFAIENMVHAGIKEIVIVLGATGQQVKNSVGNGSKFGALITYVQQDAPLGLAHCVQISEQALSSQPFLMFLGDNMFESNLDQFVDDFEFSQKNDPFIAAQLGVIPVSDASSYGVAVLDERNSVVDVEEKPAKPRSNLALVGTYGFSSDIFDAVNSIKPSMRGELEITDAIQHLILSGKTVKASNVQGWWRDTGNPQSFLDCNARVLEQFSALNAPDLSFPNTTIIPPCVIAPSARIFNSVIGPNVSIEEGVQVEGITIRNSVILQNSLFTGQGILENSIIGTNCKVNLSSITNIAQVIVGDDSSISL